MKDGWRERKGERQRRTHRDTDRDREIETQRERQTRDRDREMQKERETERHRDRSSVPLNRLHIYLHFGALRQQFWFSKMKCPVFSRHPALCIGPQDPLPCPGDPWTQQHTRTALPQGPSDSHPPSDSRSAPQRQRFRGAHFHAGHLWPRRPATSLPPLASLASGRGAPGAGGADHRNFSPLLRASVTFSGGISFINIVHPSPAGRSRMLVSVSSVVPPRVLLSQRDLLRG